MRMHVFEIARCTRLSFACHHNDYIVYLLFNRVVYKVRVVGRTFVRFEFGVGDVTGSRYIRTVIIRRMGEG